MGSGVQRKGGDVATIKSMGSPQACQRQQELLAEVQRILLKLSELARAESKAMESRSENAWLEIDKQIELTIGEKERSMGALKQHRDEHGC